ncbi:hypothetical protein [Mycolicibacterium baixiangningiae]|uniref:hypothetical protein n=1 Tax=Mycolicibacterium baixiangningiae TaxID=2761578 RepID=UPI0018D0A27E|nr:hypothetical protein [Mycolicibacterium baixiangningiae]
MHATLRPYVTAGVSLVGASAIAISPISPITPADIKVPAVATSSAAVDLVVNPIDFYGALFEESAANVEALVDIFLANPTPILSQIFDNQLANAEMISGALEQMAEGLVPILTQQVPLLLETAFAALAEGDVETALNTLLSIPTTVAALPAFIGLGAVLLPIATASGNINNVVQQVLGGAILGGAVAAFGPLLSTVGASGTAIQGVLDGVAAGDIGAVADAIVNAPGVIIDGLLNGGYGPPLLVVPAPGLLTPNAVFGTLGAGPIGFVLAIRQAIADAITPAAPLSTAEQRIAGDPEAGEGLPEAGSIADEGQTITVSTEDLQTPADGTTPEPQGGTPAANTDVDGLGVTEEGRTEVVTTVTEVDKGSGAVALEAGETSKPGKVRPSQNLRKGLQNAVKRAEQEIKSVEKRIGGAIDRLTGRSGADAKKTADSNTGGGTAGGAGNDGGGDDGGGNDGGGDGDS